MHSNHTLSVDQALKLAINRKKPGDLPYVHLPNLALYYSLGIFV